jgi:hypothetical protein
LLTKRGIYLYSSFDQYTGMIAAASLIIKTLGCCYNRSKNVFSATFVTTITLFISLFQLKLMLPPRRGLASQRRMGRRVVQKGRRPGLRACRQTHKRACAGKADCIALVGMSKGRLDTN